jgi:hypothetical protein
MAYATPERTGAGPEQRHMRRSVGCHFSSKIGDLAAFLVWGISGGAVPLPLVVMQVLAIDLGTKPASGEGPRRQALRARHDEPTAATAL